MSAPERRLPATTGWALALAAAIGTLALTAVDPAVALGAIPGLALVGMIRWFDGSVKRATVASALVPTVGLAAVVTVGAAGTLPAAALAAAGGGVGIATGTALAGRVSAKAVERAGAAASYAGFVAGGIALFASSAAEAGGVGPALAAAAWLTGDGASGLFLAIAVAVLAAAAALLALPPAAFAPPSRYDSYVLVRRGVLSSIVAIGVLAVVSLSLPVVGFRFASVLAPLVAAIADSSLVRGALAVVTVLGAAVAAFGLIARYSWSGTRTRENAVVGIAVGSVGGVVVPFVALAAGVERIGLVGSAFGGAAVLLVVVGLVSIALAGRVARNAGFAGASAIPVALAFGGVVAGASVDAVAGLETVRIGAVSLVALAAALFAYDVGRYGRTLAREVGPGGAAREPQFVRIGWSALVAVVGGSVAALGLGLATLLAPTLSVPATAAVLGGLAAVGAATWLLLR